MCVCVYRRDSVSLVVFLLKLVFLFSVEFSSVFVRSFVRSFVCLEEKYSTLVKHLVQFVSCMVTVQRVGCFVDMLRRWLDWSVVSTGSSSFCYRFCVE